VIEAALGSHDGAALGSVDDVIAADAAGRRAADKVIEEMVK
jgi:predicted NBD/HSP70 family sugar kinase